MKWVLLLLLILMTPVLVGQFKRNRSHLTKAAFALAFLPFVLNTWHLYVAPVSMAGWPGHTKGIEVSVIDFLAIAVLIATQRDGTRIQKLWPWLAYVVAVAIAVPEAAQLKPALFYLWQILRMVPVFAAAVRLTAYPKASEAVLTGLIAGACYQAGFAIKDGLQGVAQTGGAFGAQNLLGLVTHFALISSLALLLTGRRTWLGLLGLAASAIIDVLTASRATLAFAAIAAGILLALSCAKSFTGRKGAILAAVALAGAVITPIALNSVNERRGNNTVESSNEERSAFKRAAWMIIGDYPLGTGPNQYVLVSNVGGYASRAGVNWSGGSRATNVHNSYLLTWAETGPLGLFALLLVMVVPLLVSVRAALRYRRDARSDMLLGFSVALLAVSLHFIYEWAFVLFIVQYLIATVSGTAVGLAAQLKLAAMSGDRRDERTRPEPALGLPRVAHDF